MPSIARGPIHSSPLVRQLAVLLGASLLAAAILLLAPGTSYADTCIRSLEQDFNLRSWDDASRWDCGVIPGPGDTAIFPTFQQFVQLPPNIALNRDLTLARFEMVSGRIEGAYTMTITQEMVWGGGNLHYTNTAPFVSPAVTVIAPGATLNVRIAAFDITSNGTFRNFGEIRWETAPFTQTTPRIQGNRVINHQTFTIATGGEEWTTRVDNLGMLRVNPVVAGAPTLSDIRNEGMVALRDDLRVNTFDQITGTTVLTDATLTVTGFDGLILRDGALQGRGTLAGRLDNRGGTLAPNGILRLDSGSPFVRAYSQAAGATLALEISGSRRGTDYGSLTISGITELSGTLDVTFTGGFTPDPADGFIVAICDPACTGQFASNTSGLPIHYNENHIVIGANIPLPAEPKTFIPIIQVSLPQ